MRNLFLLPNFHYKENRKWDLLICMYIHAARTDDDAARAGGLCHEKGFEAVAPTDHDTVDGLEEMMTAYAKGKPVEIIPGIEYSTEYNHRDVHIVVCL